MSDQPNTPIKGRGAVSNRDGRFEVLQHQDIDDGWGPQEQPVRLATQIMRDSTKIAIAQNQSPDVPFEQSVNPYRGCEHGCVYCFARPTHSYLGLSAGLDFETKLVAKFDVVDLLRDELADPKYQCRVLALGTNTDPYQPIEKRFRLTRGILELMHETSHPIAIVTKSALIERDLDVLKELAQQQLVHVTVSITTLDHGIARRMEPRAAAPRRRLQTIEKLAQAGIPVGVNVAPVVPVLCDQELEQILRSAADAGASSAAYILLRLPWEVRELFEEWLQTYHPLKAEHVMSVVRQMRGGKAYDARFNTRRRGTGQFADLLAQRFDSACKRLGLNNETGQQLSVDRFSRPGSGAQGQLDL